MTTYDAFLQSKLVTTTTAGLTSYTLPERLFPFQRHVTGWALERGRAALFLDTGLGKTAALGLLYKQLRKDSAMSRQGIADYLVTMRKPGVNHDPVTKDAEDFPLDTWQRYASPVWMDINQSRTLQRTSARDARDERHIAPLQLDVIERCVALWTNPGDVVLDPFMGLASTGYCAIRMERRFVGIELKDSYYQQAAQNMRQSMQQQELFAVQ